MDRLTESAPPALDGARRTIDTLPALEGKTWVVWSYEHDAWWAADSCGYVISILLAGRYSEDEAKRIEEGANRHCKEPREQALSFMDALERQYSGWGRTGPCVADVILALCAALEAGEADREEFGRFERAANRRLPLTAKHEDFLTFASEPCCAKCNLPKSHRNHDGNQWPGRLSTNSPYHTFVSMDHRWALPPKGGTSAALVCLSCGALSTSREASEDCRPLTETTDG